MIGNLQYTLADCPTVQQTQLTLVGWKPVTINYGLFYPASGVTQLFWQVQGTVHLFSIPLKEIDRHHHGNYQEHFTLTLNKFREDYLSWWKEGWNQPWMSHYWDFGSLIYQ